MHNHHDSRALARRLDGIGRRLGCPDPDGAEGRPVGIVVTGTAAAAVAAYQLAESLGIDVDGLVKKGLNTVLSWIGIGTCSSKNKRKYRNIVNGASMEQLAKWLKNKRIHYATGNCNKYALAYAIKKVAQADRAEKAAKPKPKPKPKPQRNTVDEAGVMRQLQAQSYGSNMECVQKRREMMKADERAGRPWPQSLRRESMNHCRTQQTKQEKEKVRRQVDMGRERYVKPDGSKVGGVPWKMVGIGAAAAAAVVVTVIALRRPAPRGRDGRGRR